MKWYVSAIVLVVVTGAAFGAVQLETAMANQSTPAQIAPSAIATAPKCSNSYAAGLSLQSGYKSPVSGGQLDKRSFALAPGATGVLCVTYTIDLSKLPASQETLNFTAGADVVTATYFDVIHKNGTTIGYSYSYHRAPGVTVSSSPESISLTGISAPENVSVTYTFATSSSSTGYYDLFFTDNCPNLLPFVVSSSPSQATAANFPGFFEPGGCNLQAPVTSALITGETGFNLGFIGG